MSLSNLFKKATEIFTGSNPSDVGHPVYQDGETIFCKNNVCVHPASILREDYDLVHHPGYLTIHYTATRSVPGLHLVWVPNTSLHKTTALQHSRRSQSLNRYDHPDVPGNSPLRARIPRCLSHTRRDSLESQCSGCSPSVDNVSLGSIDSANETVNNDSGGETVKIYCENETDDNKLANEALKTSDGAKQGVIDKGIGEISITYDSVKEVVQDNQTNGTDEIVLPLQINVSELNSKPGALQSNGAVHLIQANFPLDLSANGTKTESLPQTSDQKTHEKNNEPAQSDASKNCRNTQIQGNSHSTRQCHISSHSETKCQTHETAQLPSKPISSNISSVENGISRVVENNAKCIENRSNSNVDISNPEYQLQSISQETDEDNIGNKCEDTSCQNLDKISTINSKNITSTITNDVHNKPINTIYTNNSTDEKDNANNSSKSNKTISGNPDDDTEELEIFNINTSVRRIPNGTKPSANGPKVSNQKPPPWPNNPEVTAPAGLRNLQDVQGQNQSLPCSPYMSRSKKSCRRFSVDLNEMKSLRLFFCDAAKTRGQFVIASRESQYKILHFHHGGLNKLAKLLNEWNFVKTQTNQPGEALPYEHFMVYQPSVSESELHPDESTFPHHIDILSFFNPSGQIEDELAFRRYIFFNGVPPKHRSLVWPFLLNYYAYNTTSEERESIVRSKRAEYASIAEQRLRLAGREREEFERGVESVVEKDVVRTDRGNPFYAGHGNPHVEVMKNILLNYAVYDAGLGYTQGMSDLLAPVLAEIKVEPDVFWCFTGLLRRGLFVCTPTDSDMEQNLNYFRELMRLMEPQFYEHLTKHVDGMELLFCHRWILLCFKREFQTENALSIWESCWSSYATEYFHLFVCLAIVSVYGTDVIAQNLRTDEMLLHFSSLANYMDAKLILRKARGLVHNFRQLSVIPCTLVRLCQQCGPGIWDSSHVPAVVCGNTSSCDCAYRNTD